MKQVLIGILTLFILINFSFTSCQKSFSSESKSKLRIKGVVLTVEWARSESERISGLQNRIVLGDNEGMIFDYGEERILSFWMKNTHIPLSIAFIDKNGIIQEMMDMSPDTVESHTSRTKARYALEVNQGWFKRNGVQVGDLLEF